MLINSAPWTWQMCKFKVHSYWYHIDFMFWLAFDSPAEPRLSGVVDSVIESLGSPQRIRVVKFQLIDPLSWISVRPCVHLLMTIPPEEKKGFSRSPWFSQVYPPVCGNDAGGRRPSLNREATAACLHFRIAFLPFFSLLVRDVFLRIVLAVGDVNSHLKGEVWSKREGIIPNVLPVCPQDQPIRKRGQSRCHIHQLQTPNRDCARPDELAPSPMCLRVNDLEKSYIPLCSLISLLLLRIIICILTVTVSPCPIFRTASPSSFLGVKNEKETGDDVFLLSTPFLFLLRRNKSELYITVRQSGTVYHFLETDVWLIFPRKKLCLLHCSLENVFLAWLFPWKCLSPSLSTWLPPLALAHSWGPARM